MSLFKVLMNAANEAVALSKVAVGDAINGTLNGIVAFVFRDSSGNATTVQLNPDGTVPVSQDAGTTLRDSQILAAAGQTKDVEAEVVSLTLTIGKEYNRLSAMVSNFRTSYFRMVYVDNHGVTPVETDLGYGLTDAGNVNEKIKLAIDTFSTVGGTGVQKLVIYHTPLDKVHDAYASVSANEAP